MRFAQQAGIVHSSKITLQQKVVKLGMHLSLGKIACADKRFLCPTRQPMNRYNALVALMCFELYLCWDKMVRHQTDIYDQVCDHIQSIN